MVKRAHHLAGTDQAAAALVEDLADRGLLDETLVVFLTEFGRTPKINKLGGRDHWGRAGSIFFAGAGVPGGQVIGATDKQAAQVITQGYSPADVAATIYHALGIDTETMLQDRQGRTAGRVAAGATDPGDCMRAAIKASRASTRGSGERRMLTIWGRPQKYSPHVSRRDFLKIGSAGGALGLADMLRLQALASPAGTPAAKTVNKSVIMVYLLGGPAPMDTYDLKPDAPAEFRGEFKPIKTNVGGIEISELFPQQAKMMDKFALIRSLSATAPNNHSDSEVMTGRNEVANARFQHPCIGSVVSKLRATSEDSVPGYVALRKMSFPTKTPLPQSLYYLNPAALGGAHAPFLPTGPGMSDFDFRADDELAAFSRSDGPVEPLRSDAPRHRRRRKHVCPRYLPRPGGRNSDFAEFAMRSI